MGKLSRKQGQAYRREAKDILAKNQQAFSQKIEEKLKIFNEIIKPRPVFVPKFIWRFLSSLFLDVPKLQKFLGVNNQVQQAPVVDLDNQIGVEIFKLLNGRLPEEEGDELTLNDFDTFIARYANQRPYKVLVEHARRLRDKELSTEKTG